MNAAGLLVAHGIVLGVAGPPVLARLTHGGHAPRSGIAAWLVAIVAFLVSWLAVGVLVAGDVLRHWHQTRSLVASCVELLCDLAAGRAGGIAQVTVLAAVAAAAAGVVFSGARLTRT
ncbi:MAG: M56 family peptidase, partial [Actinobacteria bacterium]|nr:M56 family peptidase [Actinomycetota bacterium]